MPVPVITIDGPTASGKGTVAARVARALGWAYLDSGALYRLCALQAGREGVALDDEAALAAIAQALPVRFTPAGTELAGEEVGELLRSEAVGNAASRVAALAPVRSALLHRQRAFRQAPGLVADGRDMGTVVFPDADLKVYLTASVEARAKRRHKQLIEKGISAMLPDLLRDLEQRDARDTNRVVAPLRPAEDAIVIDSTELDVDGTVDRVLEAYRARGCRAG